jgi:glycosyltransferase involved in cell wall biosynthesis
VNPCLLITIFDHGATIEAVLEGLATMRIPCLVIDDGSNADTRSILEELRSRTPWLTLERHPSNRGRGVALRTGYRLAGQRGFSHVVQLDADGQHETQDAKRVLEAAVQHPDALVLGTPVFDASAPFARRYGRWISRFWVWVETFSLQIRDPLCGLRCLPLAPTLRIIDRVDCGDHMDFDPEITVRLFWSGVPVVNVPVRVQYFEDGLSHFHMLWDNLRMSWLHTRLFLGAIWRAPRLLARRLRSGA